MSKKVCFLAVAILLIFSVNSVLAGAKSGNNSCYHQIAWKTRVGWHITITIDGVGPGIWIVRLADDIGDDVRTVMEVSKTEAKIFSDILNPCAGLHKKLPIYVTIYDKDTSIIVDVIRILGDCQDPDVMKQMR